MTMVTPMFGPQSLQAAMLLLRWDGPMLQLAGLSEPTIETFNRTGEIPWADRATLADAIEARRDSLMLEIRWAAETIGATVRFDFNGPTVAKPPVAA